MCDLKWKLRWGGLSTETCNWTFPQTNVERDRRAPAMSERPLLQAAFPKTVLKTFSQNGVISTEL